MKRFEKPLASYITFMFKVLQRTDQVVFFPVISRSVGYVCVCVCESAWTGCCTFMKVNLAMAGTPVFRWFIF